MIFIHKQLKRPAAFSAVHFDVKPQIVMLQNNFLLLHLNHEDLCDQRLWHCQEACASIGTKKTMTVIKKEDLAQVNLVRLQDFGRWNRNGA